MNELVLLSQDECIFEDLEAVLGALDGENDASNDEDGHASNEDEEMDGYWYEVLSGNELVLAYADNIPFLLRAP